MHRIIETHGKQLIDDVMDLFVIQDVIDHDTWRRMLIKNGVIKSSTKTLRTSTTKRNVTHEWYNDERGRAGKRALEEPYVVHNIICRNGRKSIVFNVWFQSNEIDQIMEELRNETN